MAIKEDIEDGNDGAHQEMREPLVGKNLADEEDGSREQYSSKESVWMVYLSTAVAVCGSFEFGCCVSTSFASESSFRNLHIQNQLSYRTCSCYKF